MTDEIPAQTGAATAVDSGAPTLDMKRAKEMAAAAADRAADVAAEAAEKAVVAAHEAFDKAGEVLGDAAERAGAAISVAADKAGVAISEATQTAITRIRNNAELPSERGHTVIANEVVEKIAGIAAREVPGVYDLGGDVARVLTSIRERLHLGEENRAQGVGARLEGRTAEISVTLVLEYGFVVSSVTDKVREKVISSVEALLELDVTAVDILVDDIHVENDGPVGDDVARAASYDTTTNGVVVGTKAPKASKAAAAPAAPAAAAAPAAG